MDFICDVVDNIFNSKKLYLKENCMGGCPCDKYSCAETTVAPDTTTTSPTTTTQTPLLNAVLVLNTNHYSNKPMVIDFEGKKKILQYNFKLLFR